MEIDPIPMGLARRVAAADELSRLSTQALDRDRVPAERHPPLHGGGS